MVSSMTILISLVLGFNNVMLVGSVLPYITDNSSENGHGTGTGSTFYTTEEKWADAVYNFIKNLSCSNVFFTTGRECRKLTIIQRSSMAVHVAPRIEMGRYKALLPDEVLSKRDNYNGVIVVDPYPKANFGHLVVVFIVQQVPRSVCNAEDDIYISVTGDCISLALKRRCRNAIKRHGRRRHYARRCEINFLPTVRMEGDDLQQLMNYNYNFLQCRDNLAGFGPCPELRPLNESTHLICNPIRDNTQRCATTREMVGTTCKMFEICDQAVLISGGWNREMSTLKNKHNLESFYWLLRKSFFQPKNIKIFYANGATGMNLPGEYPSQVHPAAMKLALRYHMQTLCRSPHCVDSLVIYLNGPAKSDGTMFLWDSNNDGLAEKEELYYLKEFMEDLAGCTAKYVHVIIDQSYAGHIADTFRNSNLHRNVIVFASSKDNEYSFGGEFTRQWVHSDHVNHCTWDVYRMAKNSIQHSIPEVKEGLRGSVRTTIFGAPCNVIPPFTAAELRHNHYGCQTLPTALWLQKLTIPDDDRFYRPPDDSPWNSYKRR